MKTPRCRFAVFVAALVACGAACRSGGGDAADADAGVAVGDPDATADGSVDPGGDASSADASLAPDALDALDALDARAADDGGIVLAPLSPLPCGGAVRCVRPGESVQAAIDGAASGDVVQVAEGTYTGSVLVQGKSLTLAGGFDSTFASRDPAARETKLVGAGSSVVRIVAAQGQRVRLDGFTITGGTGNVANAHSGAGVHVQAGDVTISNNRIVENRVPLADIHATDTRGGVLANGGPTSTVAIVSNLIANNVSGRGAGIASSGVGHLVVQANVVRANRAYSDHGGGIFIDSPDALLVRNRIEENEIGPTMNPYGWGGGVYLHGVATHARLVGNVTSRNKAPSAGSGIFVDNGAHADLDHELVFKNACPMNSGAGLLVDSTDDANPVGSVITVTRSTVTAHPCETVYSGNGLLLGGPGCKATVTRSIFWNNGSMPFVATSGTEAPPVLDDVWTMDPGFVDPDGDDFRLKPASPATGYGAF